MALKYSVLTNMHLNLLLRVIFSLILFFVMSIILNDKDVKYS